MLTLDVVGCRFGGPETLTDMGSSERRYIDDAYKSRRSMVDEDVGDRTAKVPAQKCQH
jgi:hypothetical protein